MHGYSHTALGLSTYAVTLYKKFSRSMDSGPILQLVEALAPDTRGLMSISHLTANKNGIQQLSGALQRTDLTIALLVLIAQQQEFCIETVSKSKEHLKHISNLYDEVSFCVFLGISMMSLLQCQAILFQYVEFLIMVYKDD